MRNNQTEYGNSDNKDPLCTISNKNLSEYQTIL